MLSPLCAPLATLGTAVAGLGFATARSFFVGYRLQGYAVAYVGRLCMFGRCSVAWGSSRPAVGRSRCCSPVGPKLVLLVGHGPLGGPALRWASRLSPALGAGLARARAGPPPPRPRPPLVSGLRLAGALRCPRLPLSPFTRAPHCVRGFGRAVATSGAQGLQCGARLRFVCASLRLACVPPIRSLRSLSAPAPRWCPFFFGWRVGAPCGAWGLPPAPLSLAGVMPPPAGGNLPLRPLVAGRLHYVAPPSPRGGNLWGPCGAPFPPLVVGWGGASQCLGAAGRGPTPRPRLFISPYWLVGFARWVGARFPRPDPAGAASFSGVAPPRPCWGV